MTAELRRLVDDGNGLVSRRIFVEPEIYEQELERIFARCWLSRRKVIGNSMRAARVGARSRPSSAPAASTYWERLIIRSLCGTLYLAEGPKLNIARIRRCWLAFWVNRSMAREAGRLTPAAPRRCPSERRPSARYGRVRPGRRRRARICPSIRQTGRPCPDTR